MQNVVHTKDDTTFEQRRDGELLQHGNCEQDSISIDHAEKLAEAESRGDTKTEAIQSSQISLVARPGQGSDFDFLELLGNGHGE